MGISYNFNGISLMNPQDIMACTGISWRYFIDRFRGDSGMTNKFSGMWGINTTDSNDIMGMVNVSRWARGLGLCVNSPFGTSPSLLQVDNLYMGKFHKITILLNDQRV